jgi:hypothetical protein
MFGISLTFAVPKTYAMEEYQISYTLTSTSTVISHNLSNADLEYIVDNYDSIVGHSTIIIAAGSAVESYTGKDDSNSPTDIDVEFTTAVVTYTRATHVITSSVNIKEGSQTVRIFFQISAGVVNDTGQTVYGWLTAILALLVGAFSGVVVIFWSSATGFTVYGYLMLFALVVGFVGLALGFIVRLIQK